jgi:hypothetical protein
MARDVPAGYPACTQGEDFSLYVRTYWPKAAVTDAFAFEP